MMKINDREDLHKLINALDLEIGVEIGTQKGLYAKYLLENTNLFMYLIDAWQHIEDYKDIANVSDGEHAANFALTKDTVAPFQDRCKVIKAFSVDAAKKFANGELDFVYIDANHSYQATMDDLNAWYPKVRDGGIIAGHDFLDGENICGSEFGVESAVTEFMEEKGQKFNITRGPWPTWWCLVKGR
jgi:hypothetical protein